MSDNFCEPKGKSRFGFTESSQPNELTQTQVQARTHVSEQKHTDETVVNTKECLNLHPFPSPSFTETVQQNTHKIIFEG